MSERKSDFYLQLLNMPEVHRAANILKTVQAVAEERGDA